MVQGSVLLDFLPPQMGSGVAWAPDNCRGLRSGWVVEILDACALGATGLTFGIQDFEVYALIGE